MSNVNDAVGKSLTGVVIKADGTVPFDSGCHPAVRAEILAYLTDQGHSYDPIPGTPHIKIRNWKKP